jgi:predicted outer membrane repeat protein
MHALQVLMFGGGLSATMLGGEVAHSWAGLGITVLSGTTLWINNTQFISNSVSKGTVYASWNSTVHLNNATFRDCKATNGAAIYAVGSHTSTVTGCTFENNVAWQAGGAVYVKQSTITFSSTVFKKNSAPIGGALALYDNSRAAVQAQCMLDGNVARLQTESKNELGDNYYHLGVGGAVYMTDSVASITDSFVSNNKAVMNGGECWDVITFNCT